MTGAGDLRGGLDTTSLPRLLRALVRGRKTGQLRLGRGRVIKTVSLSEGRFVFATSTDPDDRLGELLLRKGLIGYRVLEESVHAIKAGKRQGAYLVESGVLSKQDLAEGVVEHVQEIIFSLFLWEEGEYAFLEGEPSARELVVLRRPPGDLVREGIRRIGKWSRIRAGVGGLSQRYALSADSTALMSSLSLLQEEVALIGGLDGTMTLEQICAGTRGQRDFLVCRMVWGLWAAGLLDRVPQDRERSEELSDDTEPHVESQAGGSLEEEIERFNGLHRFLFQKVGEDLGGDAPSFFERAFRQASAEHEALFQGVAVDGSGELDVIALTQNVIAHGIGRYLQGLDRLLEIEFALAREVLGERNAALLEEGVLARRREGRVRPGSPGVAPASHGPAGS